MQQLTQEQARAIYDSGYWRTLPIRELVILQLKQERVFSDWSYFMTCLETVLGRPIREIEAMIMRTEIIAEIERRTHADIL